VKSPKTKEALKALGIKQEKPKELRGHEDATKPHRFKPGDERLKKNKGSLGQIVPPRAVATQRKKMNELIQEFQHIPLAKELASALGIDGEATLVEAVVMGLYLQAIKGDINATKLIQAVTEPERKPGQFPAGPPPALRIVVVDPNGKKVTEKFERPKELPAPNTALEFDFPGETECSDGYVQKTPEVLESKQLPPFAEEKED